MKNNSKVKESFSGLEAIRPTGIRKVIKRAAKKVAKKVVRKESQ